MLGKYCLLHDLYIIQSLSCWIQSSGWVARWSAVPASNEVELLLQVGGAAKRAVLLMLFLILFLMRQYHTFLS